ncbi:hypothetical protein J25TS5_04210 [Paenibacillus faecis]|uniref:hypothetical protein n=1 Tax=Paenibacillus faecis TaxID=862114 RepID=UPI001B0A2B54|nr:hypothetical protein [Paenibacillus faecis]GIO83489.1 hypothetical protein J25TS5_04210 [Paenibacillus faecis]
MKKGYKEFSETVKHLDKEDLIRQLYLAVNTPTKSEIPWQKYDPENPPSGGRYIVSDGKNWCEGFYFSKDIAVSGQYWGVSRTASNYPMEVIYYAPINLPGEE